MLTIQSCSKCCQSDEELIIILIAYIKHLFILNQYNYSGDINKIPVSVIYNDIYNCRHCIVIILCHRSILRTVFMLSIKIDRTGYV